METVPLESCLEEERSYDLTEALGKLADGTAVELPVKEMAKSVAAGETEEEEKSIDLVAGQNFLAGGVFVHYRGKEVLNNVAAGNIENGMRIAGADYHEEAALSMVAGD
jgi:vacuolar-type H+-ATPase subunit E/Vma4